MNIDMNTTEDPSVSKNLKLARGFVFEKKRRVPEDFDRPIMIPERSDGHRFQARFKGQTIIVSDKDQAIDLFVMGNFGIFIGQRMNFPNRRCFPLPSKSENENHDQSKECLNSECLPKILKNEEDDEGKKWIEMCSKCSALFLSPCETLFLVNEYRVLEVEGYSKDNDDIASSELLYARFFGCRGKEFSKNYAIYRHFRKLGWVVRDGLPFGVEFMLYKDSVTLFHATAGVRVIDPFDEQSEIKGIANSALGAIQRALSNCKKTLLLAIVEIPVGLDLNKLRSIDSIRIQIASTVPWNVNRERTHDLGSSSFE